MEITFYNGEVSQGHLEWQAEQGIDLAIVSCALLANDKILPVQFYANLVGQAQPVFAVGNPMNLLWSYTEGVISSRRIQTYDGLEFSIYQTQTPINQGNSGGGLYNQKGQLIGVNTWTQNKAITEGLNFAISTNSIIALFKAKNLMSYISDFSEEGEK
jgi:serine protease Do